jgi:putative ABC transport system permease protein
MMPEPKYRAVSLSDRRSPPGSPATSADPRRHPGIDRFVLTYLRRELRGRYRQAVLVALGLGLGVGLVMTVTAASAGVSDAQSAVLHSLYGIGTDLTVTKAAPAADNPAAAAGSGVQQDTLQPARLGLVPAGSVTSVAHLAHVASAAGGLELSGLTQSGGIPQVIPIEGVDVGHLGLGAFASGTLSAGRDFTAAENSAQVAVLDANYAAANRLSVGSTATLAGTAFRVIGLLDQPQLSGATDIYIPLARGQALARTPAGKSLTSQVNVIYVAATSADQIPDVRAEINRLLPAATVTGTGDLAGRVSGSLANTASLTSDLGTWVAAAAIIAAFVIAGLLTAAAVNRRVRELGTLKALGWPAKRIIAQIICESAATGLVGAALGIAVGFAGTAVVDAVAPKLSAIVPQQDGSGATATVAVRLAARVSPTAVLAAVLLAIAGALIAGAVGARRATRLRPADAFAHVD